MPSSTALHTTLGSVFEVDFAMQFLCQHRSKVSFRWMNPLTHDKRAIIDTLGDHALLEELYNGLWEIRKQLATLERMAA